MGSVRTKEFFLLPEDEETLSRLIVESFPEVRFLDGSRWPTRKPRFVEHLGQCSGSVAYLWHAGLVEDPTSEQRDGTGTQFVAAAGTHLFHRSRRLPAGDPSAATSLRLGRVHFSYDDGDPWDAAMKKWGAAVMRLITKASTVPLASAQVIDGEMKVFGSAGPLRAGPAAAAWCDPDQGRLLTGWGADQYIPIPWLEARGHWPI